MWEGWHLSVHGLATLGEVDCEVFSTISREIISTAVITDAFSPSLVESGALEDRHALRLFLLLVSLFCSSDRFGNLGLDNLRSAKLAELVLPAREDIKDGTIAVNILSMAAN